MDADCYTDIVYLILGAIKNAKGSRKMTAEKLGISERTLRYKLARMRDAGINVPDSSSFAIALIFLFGRNSQLYMAFPHLFVSFAF